MALLVRTGQMDDQGQKLETHNRGGAFIEHAGRAVVKRIKIVAALPALFALLASAGALFMPDRYEASVTVQIDPRPELTTRRLGGAEIPDIERRRIEREIAELSAKPVIDRVISELDLGNDPEFAPRWPASLIDTLLKPGSPRRAHIEAAIYDRLTVSRVRNTLLVKIRFSSGDPIKAARIANAIAGAYLDNQAGAKPQPASHARQPGQTDGSNLPTASERVFESLLAHYGGTLQLPGAHIIGKAVPPRNAAGPGRGQLLALAAAAGFIGAVALALFLELRASGTSPRVRSALACPHMTSVPALPVNARPPRTCPARLIVSDPQSPYAEAIHKALAALEQHRTGLPSRVVLVTSALPGEGAEHFASNLAHHAAIAGHRALLIDADLRIKSLTRQLSGQSVGLLDQIAGHAPVEDAILRDGTTGLHFLPASGTAPISLAAPAALRSLAFADALLRLKHGFATIVLSAPPLLPVVDARILAQLADQIVFVTAWHKTPRQLAKKALAALGANQSKVAGAVLTGVTDGDDGIMSFAEIVSELRQAASFSARAA